MTISQRKVIEILIRQGAVIPCGICRLAFKIEDVKYIERAHERCQHAFADEDIDEWKSDYTKQRYAHGRNDPNHPGCHKAETARDRKIRDKVRRIRGETKNGPRSKINSRNTLTKEARDKAKEWRDKNIGVSGKRQIKG